MVELKSKKNTLDTLVTFNKTLSKEEQHPALLEYISNQIHHATQRWEALHQELQALKRTLSIQIQQWEQFEQSVGIVEQTLIELKYTISQYTTPSVEIQAFGAQIARLKELLSKVKANHSLLETLSSTAEMLAGESVPAVAEYILSIVNKLSKQWLDNQRLLSNRILQLESALLPWKQYSEEFNKLHERLESQELQFETLLAKLASIKYTQKPDYIKLCENLQSEVEKTGVECENLHILSEQIQQQPDIALIVKAHIPGEVEFFAQRQVALSLDVSHHCELIKHEVVETSVCLQTKAKLDEFLDKIQKILADRNPLRDKMAVLSRINTVKAHLIECCDLEPDIVALREMNGRIPLDVNQQEQISYVFQSWPQLHTELLQHYHLLLTKLISLLDYKEKVKFFNLLINELQGIIKVPVIEYPGILQYYKKIDFYQGLLENQGNMLSIDQEDILKTLHPDDVAHAKAELEELTSENAQAIKTTTNSLTDVASVIEKWYEYQMLLSKIQHWLNSVEKEKLQLRLKHTPIKKLEKILKRIEMLLSNMAEGEDLLQQLHRTSSAIMEKCNEHNVANLRSEQLKLRQRFDNLQAGLKTWLQFLQRINNLWITVEVVVSEHHNRLKEASHLLASDIPLRHQDIVQQQKTCQDLLETATEMIAPLETLKEQEEELLEAVAPMDMKLLHHRVCLLQQLWKEIHHVLNIHLHVLAASLSRWDVFRQSVQMLHRWMEAMEKKIQDGNEIYLEDLIIKLETTYKDEIEQKEDEYKTVLSLGEKLISASDIPDANAIRTQLSNISHKWEQLGNLRSKRLSALKDITLLLQQLDEHLGKLKEWLTQTELKLNSPVIFQEISKEELNMQLLTHQKLKEDIINHESSIESIFSLCTSLQENCNKCATQGDAEAVQSIVNNLRNRWENICTLSVQRQSFLEDTINDWNSLLKNYNYFETWLKETNKLIHSPNLTELSSPAVKDGLKELQELQKNVDENNLVLDQISHQYRQLARIGRVDCNRSMIEKIKTLHLGWKQIKWKLNEIITLFCEFVDKYDSFNLSYENNIVYLKEFNEKIIALEQDLEMNPEEKILELERLSTELQLHCNEMNEMEQNGENLKNCTTANESAAISQKLQYILKFCEDIVEKMESLKMDCKSLLVTKDNGIQVDTIPTETLDMAVMGVKQILVAEIQQTVSKAEEPVSSEKDLHLQDLEAALKESCERLSIAESTLRSPTPVTFEFGKKPEGYSRHVASCRSSIDLVKHLHRLIHQEVGLDKAVTVTPDVQGIIERWSLLEAQAMEKEERLKDAHLQWENFMNDISEMENWLSSAENINLDVESAHQSFNHLETVMHIHRGFLIDLDAHKATVLSINLNGQRILEREDDQGKKHYIQEKLKEINLKWESICQQASEWQTELQLALLQCQQFHETLQELLQWLDITEKNIRQAEPVDLSADRAIISLKSKKFLELKKDLECCEPRVASLQQAAGQLLEHSSSKEGQAIKEQLDLLAIRLNIMIQLCNAYLETFTRILSAESPYLDGTSPQDQTERFTPLDNVYEDDLDRSTFNRCYHFLGRVMRAALPIQALMLLLLGVASLVPMTEHDYSCALVNNFARSLDPMLRYTGGPPPM
uniref:Nesprin-1 n=1 Tax=Hemiscolopendra marginata TaxID=943146 RepID=A0A646QCU6_9MYRI